MGVPEGYDRHRRNQTWREAHDWSPRAKKKRDRTTRARERNREPGRFGKVNWDAYQHDQLYDMIMKANLGDMSTRAGQWSALAGKIESTTGQVERVMSRVMGAWRGEAAVRSAGSNNNLMRWAGEASQTANTVAASMVTYTNTVERAQNHMPDPAFADAERNFRNGYTVTGTGGPSTAVLLNQLVSDGMVSHEAARSRKAEAVQVMETYESQSKDVHDSMPHFSDAAKTTNDQPTWTPGPDQTVERPGTPPPPPPGRTPDPTAGPTPGQAPGPDGTTSAAGFVDPLLSTTAGGPGGGGSGGGGGAGFGGGLGSLGSGGSDIVRNTPGLGAPGGPGGMSGVGPMGGRGPLGAGGVLGGGGARGGAPGGFGGMPMGQGAQGDEDKEHKVKYVEGMDFLDDMPPAYPPVFGA
jgi:PPE family protein